jgi:hypothetical protein
LVGRETGALGSVLSVSGTPDVVDGAGVCTFGGGSIRGGPFGPDRPSCAGASKGGRSDVSRSGTLSALGPVGGATGAEGTLCLAAAGAGGAVTVGGAAGAVGAEDVGDGERMTAGAGLGTGAGAGTGAVTGATESTAGGAVAEGVDVAGIEVLACTGLGGTAAAVLGFTSSV